MRGLQAAVVGVAAVLREQEEQQEDVVVVEETSEDYLIRAAHCRRFAGQLSKFKSETEQKRNQPPLISCAADQQKTTCLQCILCLAAVPVLLLLQFFQSHPNRTRSPSSSAEASFADAHWHSLGHTYCLSARQHVGR